jgi:hypothetical protein
MATDITMLLIQMITGGTSPSNGLSVNSSVLGGASALVSGAADYAQLLGTLAGPAAQAAVAADLGQIAEKQVLGQLAPGASAQAPGSRREHRS